MVVGRVHLQNEERPRMSKKDSTTHKYMSVSTKHHRQGYRAMIGQSGRSPMFFPRGCTRVLARRSGHTQSIQVANRSYRTIVKATVRFTRVVHSGLGSNLLPLVALDSCDLQESSSSSES